MHKIKELCFYIFTILDDIKASFRKLDPHFAINKFIKLLGWRSNLLKACRILFLEETFDQFFKQSTDKFDNSGPLDALDKLNRKQVLWLIAALREPSYNSLE